MLNPFRKDSHNPWLEQQRREVRRVIIAVVVGATVVLGGIGWLIHALVNA